MICFGISTVLVVRSDDEWIMKYFSASFDRMRKDFKFLEAVVEKLWVLL